MTKSASNRDRWRGESSIGLLNGECLIPDWQFGKASGEIIGLVRLTSVVRGIPAPGGYVICISVGSVFEDWLGF